MASHSTNLKRKKLVIYKSRFFSKICVKLFLS